MKASRDKNVLSGLVNNKVQDLNQVIPALTELIESARREAESLALMEHERLHRMKGEIAGLQTQIGEKEERLRATESKMSQLKQSLSIKIYDLEIDASKKQKLLEARETELKDLKAKISALLDVVTRMERVTKQAAALATSDAEQLKQMKREIAGLKAQLADKEHHLRARDSEINRIKESLSSNLQDLKHQALGLEGLVKEREAELREKNHLLEAKEEEITTMRGSMLAELEAVRSELKEKKFLLAAREASRSSKKRWIIAAIAAVIVTWIAIDLYGPRSIDIRSFDPNDVARLETTMWRSYYDGNHLRLLTQLATLLRAQYHLPFLRSHVVAYHATKAAFVFNAGGNRAQYENALPNLRTFYAAIRDISSVPFDAQRAARLELEWWIVHRERAQHTEEDLTRALAELTAEVYSMPSPRLMPQARLRAAAMTIRDTKAETGRATEQDWATIEQLLREFWRSVWISVNSANVTN